MSKLTIDTSLIASNDTQNSNNPKDVTKIQVLMNEGAFNCLNRQCLVITDSTSDQVITIPDANSEYLIIYTDQEVTIKVDGSNDIITLKPKTPGLKALCYLNRGDITSLTVSNSSGSSAKLDVVSVKI